jgi:tetratricopeptide (TPR) repeat protein
MPLSRKWFVLLLTTFCIAFTHLQLAATDKWIEVRSPNFRVLSDGSAESARGVAREFEEMRAVFSIEFPRYRLDSGSPLVILAPRDEAGLKMIAPWFWQHPGVKPAGFFDSGWEKKYAVLRLDTDEASVSPRAYHQPVVYHEYIHSLLHNNLRIMPPWLDEGLAEFYGNTRFEQSKIYIGAPNARLAVLRKRPPFPIDELIKFNPGSGIFRDNNKTEIFYGESWALIHYLMFGQGMGGGKKLNEYTRLIQQGISSSDAFKRAIGDPDEIQKSFYLYIQQVAFPVAIMKAPAQINEKDFSVRQLSEAETDAELGGFQIWAHHIDDARPLIERALKADPKLASAHENMGFIYFSEGKEQEAANEFQQAVDLDPSRYLSLFFATMLSPQAQCETAGDQGAFRSAMMQVLKINPHFAPAYVQLARLYVRQGNLADALGAARTAEGLEPSRAGYYLLSGRILLLLGSGGEAADSAKFVAERWHGPDRNEALSLWDAVPADQRSSTPPAVMLVDGKDPDANLAQLSVAEGKVRSVSCGDTKTKEGSTLVLDQNGHSLTFQAHGQFTRSGFSDTFWWGSDHYSSCQHVQGVHVVVRYKPSTNSNYAGEIVELEFRDDLPVPPLKAASPKDGNAPVGQTSEKK